MDLPKQRLELTRRDLIQLSDKELSELQKSLGEYLDTPDEKKAKVLNNAIYDEKQRRRPYGF